MYNFFLIVVARIYFPDRRLWNFGRAIYASYTISFHNFTKQPIWINVNDFGEPDTIRTYDLILRKDALYPAELRALVKAYTLILFLPLSKNLYLVLCFSS